MQEQIRLYDLDRKAHEREMDAFVGFMVAFMGTWGMAASYIGSILWIR